MTPEGWRLFAERLREAHRVFDDSKNLAEKCPQWWATALRMGLGEGWSRAEYDQVWTAGKVYAPTFWTLDTARSNFLAVKWYGQPGEWEQAAEDAAAAPDGPGMETYARCVWVQSANYRNIFRDSRVTWARNKGGLRTHAAALPGLDGGRQRILPSGVSGGGPAHGEAIIRLARRRRICQFLE